MLATFRPVIAFAAALALCTACTERSPSTAPTTATDGANAIGNGEVTTAEPNTTNVPIPVMAAACTTGAADVNVTITSKAGPAGQSSPKAFTNKILSINIDDLIATDYMPSFNSTFVAYLAALKPGMLRWPAGYDSQTYQFDANKTYVASTSQGSDKSLTPDFIDQYLALCKAVGAAPYIGINALNGSTENAAQLVRYLNVTKKAGVKWFHIGNEPDVDVTDTASQTAAYAAKFLAFRQAMTAVDPTIKLAGAELVTGARVLGVAGQPNWLAPILDGTKSAPMDAIAWHYYPKDSSQTLATSSAAPSPNNLLLETASDWPPAGLDFASQAFPLIHQTKAALAPKAEVWVDEFAEDSGKANGVGLADRAVGALWVSDALGRFAEQGADAVFRFIFKTGAEHGYALLDPNNVPRPDYYAMWLYANTFGDALVAAKSDAQSAVAVHAATRKSDGSLRVMLVNKTNVAKRVTVNLTDFAPKASGRYQLTANAYLDTSMQLNSQSLTPANIGQGEAAVVMTATPDACQTTVLTLPPVSVTVMAYAP